MESSTTAHLGEGELLHLVDRSASSWELDVWTRHVIGCGECSARLAERQQTAEAVSTALRSIQLPAGFRTAAEAMASTRPGRAASARRSVPLRMRGAAAGLIVLLPVLLVSPVRAAVFEWLRQGWAEMTGSSGAAGSAEAEGGAMPEAAEVETSYTVSFTPSGASLRVAFASGQRTGEISIGYGSGNDASLLIRSAGTEAALLTDDGFSITNRDESAAQYSVSVPRKVTAVRVHVGDQPVLELTATDLAEGWSYDLGAGRP